MIIQFKSAAVAGIFLVLCSASPFTNGAYATGFAFDSRPASDSPTQEVSSEAAIEAVASYSLMFRVMIVTYEQNEQWQRLASEEREQDREDAGDENRTRLEQNNDETADERDENDDSDPISDAVDTVLSFLGL